VKQVCRAIFAFADPARVIMQKRNGSKNGNEEEDQKKSKKFTANRHTLIPLRIAKYLNSPALLPQIAETIIGLTKNPAGGSEAGLVAHSEYKDKCAFHINNCGSPEFQLSLLS